MQKHYRDFTVGELLDMGADVEINQHSLKTEEQGKKFTSQFENTKQSSHKIDSKLKVVEAWDKRFKTIVFIKGQ